MANQKLTQEELDKLQDIQQKNAALVQELGSISLAEINVSERKEKAKEFLGQLRGSEQELAKELEEKYGVGSIDLSQGEFIPAPQQEEPATETKTVE
jgi:hypothetical protein